MPRQSERLYYTNRKAFYSVHLLAVVDAVGRFRYIDVGASGAMSDSHVLRGSSLVRTHLQLMIADRAPLVQHGRYILADGGFAMLPFMLQNFPKTETRLGRDMQKRTFNHWVGTARGVVERAFGQLKQRFKRLGGRSSYDRKERVVQMVEAACALHNLHIRIELEHGISRVPPHEHIAMTTDPEVCALQRYHTVPSGGNLLGSDQKVREAANTIRQRVAAAAWAKHCEYA